MSLFTKKYRQKLTFENRCKEEALKYQGQGSLVLGVQNGIATGELTLAGVTFFICFINRLNSSE